MNCLYNAPITDIVCVFPIAQQVIGIGSIIINIMKIAKEFFSYPLSKNQLRSEIDSQEMRLAELKELIEKATDSEITQSMIDEVNIITINLSKIETYALKKQMQNKRDAHYLDNIKIGFYRCIPLYGTFYSLKQCHKKWSMIVI